LTKIFLDFGILIFKFIVLNPCDDEPNGETNCMGCFFDLLLAEDYYISENRRNPKTTPDVAQAQDLTYTAKKMLSKVFGSILI